jgi:putative transposase
VIWRFISAERANHRVSTLCRVLGVSRSGFYAWVRRPPSARAVADLALATKVEVVHARSRGTYGAPRVHAELAAQGVATSRKRIARIMAARGLTGVSPRRGTVTTTPARLPAPPDLVARRFAADEPNRLWVGDLSYVRTWQGWLYVAALLDVHSRRVVGWACADHLRAELPLEALDMAVTTRRPRPGLLIHHTDRGSQYLAQRYAQRLRAHRIAASVGKVGCALDNALAESFFGTLKTELVNRRSWPTRKEATNAIAGYLAFYNHDRRHSKLGYHSPAMYETLTANRSAA